VTNKVLLIGAGAREHAIAKAIVRSSNAVIYAVTKNNNPGITALAVKVFREDESNSSRTAEIAKKEGIDVCIIGPEAPLAAGVADALDKVKIPCFGPKREAARLETSKAFTRDLLVKYKISGNPDFKKFASTEGVAGYAQELLDRFGGFVVKPDGLTGGKGVKISGEHLATPKDAEDYARELVSSKHDSVIVEEKLEGEEFSLQAFSGGGNCASTPLVQDHKRAFDDDVGENTGGMGSYSMADHSMPFVTQSDVEQAQKINAFVAQALEKEFNEPYVGVLYGGFMATKNGLRLLEYNARFGDPETMNVLPILENDFVELLRKACDGSIKECDACFAKRATVVKYLVPAGYPSSPVAGDEVKVDAAAFDERDTQLFYAAVNEKNGVIKTTKSRTAGVLGIGDSLEEAEQRAQNAVCGVKGNLRYRKDIGTQALIQKRIEHMRKLRG